MPSENSQTNRVDTILGIALLPYLTFLVRRSLSIGDAIEVSLVLLLEVRLLLSVAGYIPMTNFENSIRGAVAMMLTLVMLNLMVAYLPALRRKF